MMKSTYFILGILIAIAFSSFVLAEAQNKTLVIGEVKDSSGNTLNDVKVSVTCNSKTVPSISDDSGYLVLFDDSVCSAGDTVTIKAEKSGYNSATYSNVGVDTCLSSNGTLCQDNSANSSYMIFNLAVKSITLSQSKTTTTTHSSGGGGGYVAITPKNVTNSTQSNVTVTSQTSNDNSNASLSNDNSTVVVGDNASDSSSSNSITGAVVGAVKANAFVTVLLFIAAVLVAYMFVLRQRKKFY